MNDGSMKVLVFGGTTEGRLILESGLPCLYSTATAYGSESVTALPGQEIISGRLDAHEMTELMSRPDIAGVIDATHPYATEARKTIAAACEAANRPLFRVAREGAENREGVDILSFASAGEAADYLGQVGGNALVTVGSKEMGHFTKVPGCAQRLHFRVLPTSEVLLQCEALGISASRLIAEQGPFSERSNRAHLERARARFLVTKDGGPQGGMEEKFRAARACNVKVMLIERPKTPEAYRAESGGPDDAIRWGRRLPGVAPDAEPGGSLQPATPLFPMFVSLKGKRVLVAGGGGVALRKASVLAECGAVLRVVAPETRPEFESLIRSGNGELLRRPYETGDLQDVRMAIAATNDRAVNARVANDAGGKKIPVNVADAPEECSFFFPSFVEHDGYVAGISSSGRSPARCRRLADTLRACWKDWVENVKADNGKK